MLNWKKKYLAITKIYSITKCSKCKCVDLLSIFFRLKMMTTISLCWTNIIFWIWIWIHIFMTVQRGQLFQAHWIHKLENQSAFFGGNLHFLFCSWKFTLWFNLNANMLFDTNVFNCYWVFHWDLSVNRPKSSNLGIDLTLLS